MSTFVKSNHEKTLPMSTSVNHNNSNTLTLFLIRSFERT